MVWTVDAFVDSDDAEAALCANRTAFVQRDVKTLIPSHIWKQIAHPGDITQNVGFQKLFLILNTNPAADGLRQLVVDYFNDSPPLRAHLKQPGAAPPPFVSSSLPKEGHLKHGQKDARGTHMTPKFSTLAPPSSVDMLRPSAANGWESSRARSLGHNASLTSSGRESPRARSYCRAASPTSARPHGRRAISLSGDDSVLPWLDATDARENLRARSCSHVALTSRAVPSPQRRRRAISLSGDGSAPQPLGAIDSSNPVLEMRGGALLGVANVLNQFSKMNRTIHDFCERNSDYIGQSKRVPRRPSALPEHGPMGKPAYEFSCSEDFVFFTLLSIINTHLYDDIFRPFHPAASAQESDRYEEHHLKLINTCLQQQSATWRSQTFSSIDNKVNADGVANLVRGFARAIIRELINALKPLAGQASFPDSFIPDLESILKTAYDWNRIVKKDTLKYDFEPYVVEPLANWDPVQMESFEQLPMAIRPNTKVISSISLGLVTSVSLGGSRVSHVKSKARVLVEEWFFDLSRGQSAHPTSPNGETNSASPSAACPGQLSAIPMMSMSPPPREQQVPVPSRHKGFLCC